MSSLSTKNDHFVRISSVYKNVHTFQKHLNFQKKKVFPGGSPASTDVLIFQKSLYVLDDPKMSPVSKNVICLLSIVLSPEHKVTE